MAVSRNSEKCFGCHQLGHWVQDCPNNATQEKPQFSPAHDNVPEKLCSCGSGPCLIKTSRTQKNPGRKYYRCQCGFFEWCDELGSFPSQNLSPGTPVRNPNPLSCSPNPNLSPGTPVRNPSLPSWNPNSNPNTSLSSPAGNPIPHPNPNPNPSLDPLSASPNSSLPNPDSNPSSLAEFGWRQQVAPPFNNNKIKRKSVGNYSETLCRCGAGRCHIFTTKKKGPNTGRQFLSCPVRKGEGSCGFFKWCDDVVTLHQQGEV